MRKYRTLLRRLWRNAPPERVPIRVHWVDGATIVIHGDNADPPTKPAPPVPGVKPRPQNEDYGPD